MSVKVITNAKNFQIEWSNNQEIKLRVKSPAIKGKANKEIIDSLKKLFRTEVVIIDGLRSQKKTLLIKGKNPDDVKKITGNSSSD